MGITPHTGDAQSSSEAVLAAMMGGCCGVERVPGEDGANRSGNRCTARVLRAEACAGSAAWPG